MTNNVYNQYEFSSSFFFTVNRGLSSIQNASKETFVLGHRNPDTDAITAAIVYANFLNRMNIPAKPYRLGDLNNETKFVLKTAGMKEPDMLPDNVPNGTEIALVDHNESKMIFVFISI